MAENLTYSTIIVDISATLAETSLSTTVTGDLDSFTATPISQVGETVKYLLTFGVGDPTITTTSTIKYGCVRVTISNTASETLDTAIYTTAADVQSGILTDVRVVSTTATDTTYDIFTAHAV